MTDERLAALWDEAGRPESTPLWPPRELELLQALKAERERIAQLEDQLDDLAGGTHSCHAKCQRPGCVQRRRIAELESMLPTKEALEVFAKSEDQHKGDLPFDGRFIPNQWLLNERGLSVELAERIAELEAQKSTAYKEVEIQCRKATQLEARLDAVKRCRAYICDVPEIGRLCPVLRKRDVLEALGGDDNGI